MKIKLDRIISIATLVAAVVAIVLVLKKPTPVAQSPQVPAGIAANAQSFNAQSSNQKAYPPEPAATQTQPTQPSQSSGGYTAGSSSTPQPSQSSQAQQSSKAEAHINSEGIGALLAQAAGAAGTAGAGGLSPDSDLGSGEPNIKDQQVTYEGDVVHGRFLTEIAGKDVWVTISGHMGSKDGYATFEPTEFKVGDVSVPVSLVNPALQRKLAEERDRLKVPN
jgi:hypothetical protein